MRQLPVHRMLALCLLAPLCSSGCTPGPERSRASAEPTYTPSSTTQPAADGKYRAYLPVVGRQFDQHPRPRGFGVGGGGGKHTRWFYNWGYGSAAAYNNPLYLPMIWGGPPADQCNPDHPAFDPAKDCRCTWRETNVYNYASECNPGCASAKTSYVPGHEPGCTHAQRVAFAERYVRFIRQAPAKRKGRTWLLYNEPENSDQAALDPREAALLANVLIKRVHAEDPAARFYCCGTMVFNEEKRRWMRDFAAHLSQPLDGLHYHNYYAQNWFDAEGIKAVMRDFYHAMQSVTSAAGQRFGGLPMLITEWAGLFPKPAKHRCANANNRDRVMRPVAAWLNRQGASYGIDGAAWFISAETYWPSCGLFFSDGSPTCLGREYATYRWGQVP